MSDNFRVSSLWFNPRSFLNLHAPLLYSIGGPIEKPKPVELSLEDKLWKRVIDLEKDNSELQRVLAQNQNKETEKDKECRN